MNVAASIEYGAQHFAERIAIDFGANQISYSQLNQMANRAACALQSMGIRQGDRVALVLPNTPLFVYSYFGALKLGAIVVAVNPALTSTEIGYVVKDSGAQVVIDESGSFEHRLSISASDVASCVMSETCPAAIAYTSGTTGFPKGATLSHGNILFNSASKKRYLNLESTDRLLLFLPLFHCFGQNAIMNAALQAGATLLMQSGFDVECVLECLAAGRANMFFGVPTNFAILLDRAEPRQLAPVRLFFSAAAPLPQKIEAAWRAKFNTQIYQGYGLTETSPFASYNHLKEHRTGSIGTPIEGVEMAIADVVDGHLLQADEVGEIVVRGPNVMLAYWNKPQETAEVIRDGWFYTGDIGRMDADGYFTVEDRLKDMVIVGGSNVYPIEVENALLGHPAVAEVAVFGTPDDVLGERVQAAVVRNPGTAVTVEDLISHCRETLTSYKIPAQIAFVAEIPKNRTGKVLKRVLREQYKPLPQRAPLACTSYELKMRLMEWLGQKLKIPSRNLNPQRAFSDLGLTSLMAVELAQRLAEWTGLEVTPTIAWTYSSADSLVGHIFKEDLTETLSDDEAEVLLLEQLELLEK